MNFYPPQKDLIVLVADKDMESSLKGILARNHSLGIREISFDIFVHPYKDPGCLNISDQFMRSFIIYLVVSIMIK